MTLLDTPLLKTRKIDKKHAAALSRLGLSTIRDLILYFPINYEDFSTIVEIKNIKIGQTNTVKGIITEIANEQTKRQRMMITKAVIEDKSGSLNVVWFRQPYLESYLRPGTYVTLSGKVELNFQRNFQMISPVYERYRPESLHTGRIVPVYSLTSNITSKWLRFFLKPFLKHIVKLEEFLPENLIKAQKLMKRDEAIKQIHFPKDMTTLKKAKFRLAFEEMFLLQATQLQKKAIYQKNKARPIKFDEKLIRKFVKTLPFTLTDDQKKAAWQIFKDLEKKKPMNRLLEGDVGSGKTVVAVLALYLTLKKGSQAIMLAPTEILAAQHYQTVSGFLKKESFKIALLTGTKTLLSNKKNSRKKIYEKLKQGKIDLVVGTHALLNKELKGQKIALVIVDEQHRFGVKQRASLKKINISKTVPHFLSMTATPIPRTLALSIYGDLDLSVIKEMPKHRKKVKTKLVSPFDREKTYNFIKKRIVSGDQVFVICPLIEESDVLGVKSATEEFEKLKKEIFPDLSIGLLHGKLKKEQKDKAMKNFLNKKHKILVSTSVIEVGIDIKNATIMMIEGAERFGLSQLHQFRGRVGRDKKQSFCFLFTESMGEKGYLRLKTMEQTESGFELAKKDLELRGPGEVYGVRQSGIPDLKMASLQDYNLVASAREEARKIIQNDPNLEKYPKIKKELEIFEKTVHFE